MPRLDRRELLRRAGHLGLSATGLALLAGCSRLSTSVAPASPSRPGTPLETTTLRFAKNPSMCFAPIYLAYDLLRARGFTDVQYVDLTTTTLVAVAAGEADMAMSAVGVPIVQADADDSVVILGGVHVGCMELFASSAVRSMSDLKGKRVATPNQGSGNHVHFAAMAAYVGIDPSRDLTLVYDPVADAVRQFTAGQVDAYMGFPPGPQELRAKGIGHVIVNTHTDRPWSQYFCCVVVANRAFVQQHPVAAKHGLRAVLEAADLCVAQPERAAEDVVKRGFADDVGLAQQMLKHDVAYDRWRDYDPEDTVRFFSLRLQEVGMIKSSPVAIIRKGTDWRFLNELKQELKA
jgi:NitT/TauT family transport system substrate-binding protein